MSSTITAMTQHFTTPEFAETLKQFGIKIDSLFYVIMQDNGINEMVPELFVKIPEFTDKYISMQDKCTYTVSENNMIYPAYLLSQVLGWLPETYTRHIFHDQDGLNLIYKPHTNWIPLERFITQCLTEGWLTPQMILENAKKDNQ